MGIGVPLGPVNLHSRYFYETSIPGGFFPSRNFEGGYVAAYNCPLNQFVINVKSTQDLIVGPEYLFGVELHYPVH